MRRLHKLHINRFGDDDDLRVYVKNSLNQLPPVRDVDGPSRFQVQSPKHRRDVALRNDVQIVARVLKQEEI
jgi:hypothetical protein